MLSILAPLVALALPWENIKDAQLAENVERWGVGSATEIVWGFQYPLAYLFPVLWIYPVLSVLNGSSSAKNDVLSSLIPFLIVVLTGSVFTGDLGPMLCLAGALVLPCGAAKLHRPDQPAFSAIKSILLPPPPVTVDEEVREQMDLGQEEPVGRTDSTDPGPSSPSYSPALPQRDSPMEAEQMDSTGEEPPPQTDLQVEAPQESQEQESQEQAHLPE